MFLKTLAFLLLLYILIKVISRTFLPSASKKKSNASFFYQTFRNIRKQQKKQKDQSRQSSSNNFDEIEEADFEEITDEESKSDGN